MTDRSTATRELSREHQCYLSVPRFYFDLRFDDEPWSDDDLGNDFDSLEQAREEAVTLMAEIVKDRLRKYRQVSIRVRNHQPEPLLILNLSMTAQERSQSGQDPQDL